MGSYPENVVLATQPSDLIGYWQLNETSGTTADDASSQANDGTYANVTLDNAPGPHGDNRNVPAFNGSSSSVKIHSSGLNSDFNGNELSFAAWCKVDSGIWTDGNLHFIVEIRVDDSNQLTIYKSDTNHRLYFLYKAGGTTRSYNHDFSPTGPSGWFHVAMVASSGGNFVKFYVDGSEVYSTGHGITWSGTLDSNRCNVGSRQHTGPTYVWDGNLGDAALWKTPLSASEVALLAEVYSGDDLLVQGNARIIGQLDVPQLVVQGVASQTEALQNWQDNSSDILARVTAEGRLQVGSFADGEMATDDALIEAHRSEGDTGLPARGLNMLGEITGTLSSIVQWAVQELVLKGTGGISALHSALRVKLTNQNTGTMSAGADLRAGDFEAINEGGSSGQDVPELTGLHVTVSNASGAYLDTAYGLKVEMSDDGNQNEAFAIHAEGGLFHLGVDGEVLELPVTTSTPANPPSNHVRFYVELNSGTPELFIKKSDGTRYKVALTLVT